MKSILLIVPSISFGGLEKVAITTAELLKENYRVFLIYFYKLDAQQIISPEINIICLDTPYSTGFFGKLKVMIKRNIFLKKFKIKNKIDYSLSFGKVASVSNALSKQSETCITSLHGYTDISKSFFFRFIDKIIYSKSNKTICVSKALLNEFLQATNIKKDKLVCVYNPFDIDKIVRNSILQCGEILGAPALFSYGRIVKEKNFEVQILALKEVVKSCPNAVLNILGDGENKQSLIQLANSLGMQNNVNFLNQTDNPFKYLSKADMLLITSYNEGFVSTAIESMVCKTPVIAADCKVGMREMVYQNPNLEEIAADIEFGDYGILTPPFYYSDSSEEKEEKVNILAKAICMLNNDKAMQELFIEKAHEKAKEMNLENYKLNLLKVLES